MTRLREIRDQMEREAAAAGVTVKCVEPRDDVSGCYAVILSEELRDMPLAHPRVVRQ